MITLENVTKVFGENIAVNNLSLSISKGECFAFLGPNGAGKTTTIKLITGLLKPSRGRICIDGYDISKDYIVAKRKIGYIPDVPYLYDKLTGYEFLDFIARLFGIPVGSIKEKIKDMLKTFDIDRYKYELIENYSHGIKQRLAICSALIHDPEVIIVDEPMVALDPVGIRLVKDIFKNKIKQGVTIFMSTHTLSIAEEIATKIGIINKGKLRAFGTKDELRLIANSADIEDIFLQLTYEEK